MNNPCYTEDYEDYTINVYYDELVDNPREFNCTVANVLSFARDYKFDNNPYKSYDDLLVHLLQEYEGEMFDELENDTIYYGGGWHIDDDQTRDKIQEVLENHVVMQPIAFYSHSVTTIWLGSPSDPWDSGYLGICYQTKADTIHECGATEENWKEKAMACMESEIKELDHYMQGECYAYEVLNPDGEEIDACGGFIGDIDWAIKEARSSADWDIQKRKEEQEAEARALEEEKRKYPTIFTEEEMAAL